MTGSRLPRRTLVYFVAIGLLALAGVAAPTAAFGAAVTTAVLADPDGKPSKDPKPCHGRDCPTGGPTPTSTGSPANNPQPSDSLAPGTTTPADPAAPPPSGQQVVGGAPGAPGGPGGPGGTGQTDGGAVPAGAVPATDGNSGVGAGAPRPAAATTPADRSLPLWPILWGGTALIALVTAGLLVALRDRRMRPASGRQEPEQGVASPSGPIRMDWIEPPG